MSLLSQQDFVRSVLSLCAWLALLSAVFVTLERLFALRPARVLRPGFAADLAYYFLSSLLPGVLLSAPLGLLAWAAHAALPGAWHEGVAALPPWARIAATFVVGQVGFYWGHRWSHEVPWLWRFHAIHHSAEHVDWLVNTRAHPLDMVFERLCGLVPLYVLGLAGPGSAGGAADKMPVMLLLVGTAWGFFIHANVRWRFGPLEWLVATPAFHHWHHTNDTVNRDRNYAAMLPVLDRIFGTLHLPRHWPETYGVDKPVGDTLAQQLAGPLIPDRLTRTRGVTGRVRDGKVRHPVVASRVCGAAIQEPPTGCLQPLDRRAAALPAAMSGVQGRQQAPMTPRPTRSPAAAHPPPAP